MNRKIYKNQSGKQVIISGSATPPREYSIMSPSEIETQRSNHQSYLVDSAREINEKRKAVIDELIEIGLSKESAEHLAGTVSE